MSWADEIESLFVKRHEVLSVNAVLFVAEEVVEVWISFGFKPFMFHHLLLILSILSLLDLLSAHLLCLGHLALESNLVAELYFGHLMVHLLDQ